MLQRTDRFARQARCCPVPPTVQTLKERTALCGVLKPYRCEKAIPSPSVRNDSLYDSVEATTDSPAQFPAFAAIRRTENMAVRSAEINDPVGRRKRSDVAARRADVLPALPDAWRCKQEKQHDAGGGM